MRQQFEHLGLPEKDLHRPLIGRAQQRVTEGPDCAAERGHAGEVVQVPFHCPPRQVRQVLVPRQQVQRLDFQPHRDQPPPIFRVDIVARSPLDWGQHVEPTIVPPDLVVAALEIDDAATGQHRSEDDAPPPRFATIHRHAEPVARRSLPPVKPDAGQDRSFLQIGRNAPGQKRTRSDSAKTWLCKQ